LKGTFSFQSQERAEQLRYPPRGVWYEARAAEHAKARHQHAHQHHVQIRPQPRDRVQGTWDQCFGSESDQVSGSVSGSRFGCRIRIQEGKNDPQKF
jgi:hypothetical protein